MPIRVYPSSSRGAAAAAAGADWHSDELYEAYRQKVQAVRARKKYWWGCKFVGP